MFNNRNPPKFQLYQTVYVEEFECQIMYVNRHSTPFEYVLQFPDKSVGPFRENEIDIQGPKDVIRP